MTPKPQRLAYFLLNLQADTVLGTSTDEVDRTAIEYVTGNLTYCCDTEQSISVYFSIPLVRFCLFYQFRGDLKTIYE